MCCATNRKIAGSIPGGVSGFFIDIKSLRSHYGPGFDSASNKWVPGAFPGGKGGRCVRLTTLPPSCAVVMKSGNLNFLEPSGPPQACNGTALPLHANVVPTSEIRTTGVFVMFICQQLTLWLELAWHPHQLLKRCLSILGGHTHTHTNVHSTGVFYPLINTVRYGRMKWCGPFQKSIYQISG